MLFLFFFLECQTWDTINDVEYTDSINELIEYTYSTEAEIQERAVIKLTNKPFDENVYKRLISFTDYSESDTRKKVIQYLATHYNSDYEKIFYLILESGEEHDILEVLKGFFYGGISVDKKMQQKISSLYQNFSWDVQLYAAAVNAKNDNFDGEEVIINIMNSEYVLAKRKAAELARYFKTKIMYVGLMEYIDSSNDTISREKAKESLSVVRQTVKVSKDELGSILANMPSTIRYKIDLNNNNSLLFLGFKSSTIEKEKVKFIGEMIKKRIYDTGLFKIITEKQRETAMKELEFSLSGLTEDNTLKLGKMLSSKFIVSGLIEMDSTSAIDLSIRLFEVETGQSLSLYTGSFNSVEEVGFESMIITTELLQPFL